MPITLKKGILKYKNTSTGQYEGVDVVAETATSDQVEAIEDAASAEISAIEAKGVETRESIPDDYTALSDEVDDLKSQKVDKNGINQVDFKNVNALFPPYTEEDISENFSADAAWYVADGRTTIKSASGQPGTDRDVIDLSDYSGLIKFGFDYTTSMYGSNFLFIGTSTVSGAGLIEYKSRDGIKNNSIAWIDKSHVEDDKYLIIDLDILKETYPTAIGLFFTAPASIWQLKELTPNSKKTLDWLLVDRTQITNSIPQIVVATDGSGDYTTISDAISHANNGDTIYIKDGEYKETVIVNKYVHLVGESKQGTILYNDVGDYDNAPLSITQGSVCNMTIKSLAPLDTSGLSTYAYAIHLDKNFATLAKYQKCEIYNCDIYSEVNDAIGAGTNYATEYDVHDCFLHVAHNPVKTGACGFKCHNGQNQTTGKITLKNNIIITKDADGTTCYDILYHNGGISNTQQIEILQVGNVLKYYRNTITNIFVPSAYNYGNSVAIMNTLA